MSKGIQLSKIEQDALRYRVLARFVLSGCDARDLANAHQQGVPGLSAKQLDKALDESVMTEDIADILIEATQPSLSPLHSAESLEEHCVTATREIAESIRRGIYQPLLPTDVDVLRTCAKLAEQMQQCDPVIAQTTQMLRANTTIAHNVMTHFLLALLASPDHSIRIPIALVKDFKIEDYVLESTDDLDKSATTFTIKRKQEHQR